MALNRTTATRKSNQSDGRLAGLEVAIVGIYFPPEMTGIAPYSAAVAHAVLEAGATVHVITGVPHFPMWRTQEPFNRGFRFEEVAGALKIARRRHWVPRKASLSGRAIMEGTFLAHASPSVFRSRADVIVAVTPSLSSLGAAQVGRCGRPLGVVVQDFTGGGASQTGTAGSTVSNAIARLEGRLLRRADQVGVISSEFVEQALEIGIRPDRISLLPNFTHIDPINSTISDARAELGWEPGVFTVVHTGNMGLKQGLHHVIDAARLAEHRGEQIRWVFVGDGNQRGNLEDAAQGLPSIRFIDPLPEDVYPYALAAADVLLLNENPGVKEFCLPSKLTSYVVAGRPIVAATEPGGVTYRTVDRHGFAHLVPAGDPLKLLAGLERIRLDRQLRERLTRAAAEYAPQTSRPDAAERYVKFVEQLGALVDQR